MKGYVRAFAVGLALIVLALTLAVVPPKHASAPTSTNVTVTNPTFAVAQATVPRTVAGAVSISGTPNVNATITGTPAVTLPSHLGLSPSQFVDVQCGSFTSCFEVSADGTTAAFSIPNGSEFVVTDVLWKSLPTSLPCVPGSSASIILLPLGVGPLGLGRFIDFAPLAQDCSAFHDVHLPTGFAMTTTDFSSSPVPGTLVALQLQGYLVPIP